MERETSDIPEVIHCLQEERRKSKKDRLACRNKFGAAFNAESQC
jgi:hypothetical protein